MALWLAHLLLPVIVPVLNGQVEFEGAPAPEKSRRASPLEAEEQLDTFTLPPGFKIELVAADPDLTKTVTVAFDDAGRMWAITAVEYPIDENESPERARALFSTPGRDRVLVFDTPAAPGRQKPRVFADGLAIPLGVLPHRDGVIVGHGPDIVFLRDTDRDGRADVREVLLSGFGIQDSHLYPHQFTRGPGDWIYLAQGAFNYSRVRDRGGRVTPFDQTKMARFRPDGTGFEIVCWGPNNIWGFVIDRQGNMFIQEANDLGYPMVPFHLGAAYPGIGMHKPKPYAPWQPPLADFSMGGTGLSGLARAEDRQGFPPPYHGVFYVANPITGKIQAIRARSAGAGYSLEKLPDFIQCGDPWFRPVAIHFGPDRCLYIVDWYNQIISHNEVPRDHPDRDKTRGRIWRVRHQSMSHAAIPDLTRVGEGDLPRHLDSDSVWQSRAAWHQIVDRKAAGLAPRLKQIVQGTGRDEGRILALWSLDGLGAIDVAAVSPVLRDHNPNLRREAIRSLGNHPATATEGLPGLRRLLDDPDPQVRAELIRTLDRYAQAQPDHSNLRSSLLEDIIALLVQMAKPPLEGPTVNPQQGGGPVKTGPAADREFERYLARAALERHPERVRAFLESHAGRSVGLESRMVALLAVGGPFAASQAVELFGRLGRALDAEELVLLARHVSAEPVAVTLGEILLQPRNQVRAFEQLLAARDQIDTERLRDLLRPAAVEFARRQTDPSSRTLLFRLASGYRIRELEPEIVAVLRQPETAAPQKLAAIRALREIGSTELELFRDLAVGEQAGSPLQTEAVLALVASGRTQAGPLLAELWPALPGNLRKVAVDRLAGSPAGARALLDAIQRREISRDELDEYTLEKLGTVLPGDPALEELTREVAGRFHPVLRLNGQAEDSVLAGINLEGAFTVETWIKLDPGIDNRDAILGSAQGSDFNFYQGKFRIYAGTSEGDVLVASRAMVPEVWTHLAVTRNAQGDFRIFTNGELDAGPGKPSVRSFSNLNIGHSVAPGGTAGWLTEFRVWNRDRSADEIRASFTRSFQDASAPPGLVHCFSGAGSWPNLAGQARLERIPDVPPLLTAAEAEAERLKFERFRQYAEGPGESARGQAVFGNTCATCHQVQGQGGSIGPTLNGAGTLSTEALLRSLLTPNAAMEPGYRRYRIETKDNEFLEGFLVAQEAGHLVLRQPNSEDQRVPRKRIRRAHWTRLSLMPEGLLEALKPAEIADLFAYLRTLK